MISDLNMVIIKILHIVIYYEFHFSEIKSDKV